LAGGARPLLGDAVSRIADDRVLAVASGDDVAGCPVTAVDGVGTVLTELLVLTTATADRVRTVAPRTMSFPPPAIDEVRLPSPHIPSAPSVPMSTSRPDEPVMVLAGAGLHDTSHVTSAPPSTAQMAPYGHHPGVRELQDDRPACDIRDRRLDAVRGVPYRERSTSASRRSRSGTPNVRGHR
jgi:hypothetical protein